MIGPGRDPELFQTPANFVENRPGMGSGNEAKTKEILTKRKTTKRRLRRRPKVAALRAAPLGVVVFRLVRISLVFPHFGAPKFREIWPPTKTLRDFF